MDRSPEHDNGRLILRALRNLGLLAAALLALRLTAVYGCTTSVQRRPSMVVTSFATLGTGRPDRPSIRFRFSRPAVSQKDVGEPLSDPPAVVGPMLSIRGHWSDRQTLVLEPRNELKPGLRYNVYLVGELAKQNQKTRFHFVHAPLQIRHVSGLHGNRIATKPRFRVHFNYRVKAGDVASHCYMHESSGLWPVALATPVSHLVSDVVTVTTDAPLSRNQQYNLRCDDLQSAQGGAPITAKYPKQFQTYPAFTVVRTRPGADDYPPGDVPVQIHFSSPVTLPELRRHLRIEPPVQGLTAGYVAYPGLRYRVTLKLQSRTRYKVTVDGGVRDIYGQQLGRAHSFDFTTGRPAAVLNLERGIYALEAGSTGYPVWTRNMERFQVDCAPVPKGQLVSLLTSDMSYDPWYSGNNDKPVRWKKLGLKSRRTDVTFQSKETEWKLHHLTMHKMCGSKRPRGVYLAEVKSDQLAPHPDYHWRYRPRQRILANVTDLGVLLKVGPASGIAWVSSLRTGKPVAYANVTLYDPKGKVVHRGRTDHRGLARLPGTSTLIKLQSGREQDWVPQRRQRLIAVVEKGKDLAVVDGNWANGIQLWNFGVTVDRSAGTERIRGFIQSDRGIYRPGETVHFKGLVRTLKLGALPRVPRGAKVRISVRDGRGSKVLDTERKLSRFGGFAFDLPLGASARLGDYYVRATVNKQTFQERFSVQAFRKVTYEIKMKAGKRHVQLGDTLRLDLAARYLFGAPVKNSRYAWRVQRREHALRFDGFPGYVFDDWAAQNLHYWDQGGTTSYSFVSEGDGKTDALGKASVALETGADQTRPQDYLASVTVTDETDQSVTKSLAITAHRTDRYVGLHTQEYVQAVGMPFAVNAVALSPAGNRIASAATLSYVRSSYECTWQGTYRAYRTCSRKKKEVWSRPVQIPATGTGTLRIVPRKPGEHIIRLTVTDGKGRKISASNTVWIIGRGQAFWSGDESVRMALIASKKSYKPGETARLVPRSSLGGATALVTLERNGVMDAFVTTLRSSGQGIQIPLRSRHAPNVYATVTLVRGRVGVGDRNRPRFSIGVVNLQVSPVSHRLKVRLRTHKDKYEPGELVQGKIRVTSAAGRPVRAELSLSVADEGVLQLIAYRTPDPLVKFFAPWGIGVDNATNWNRVSRLNAPGVKDRESGADGGDEGSSGPKVRSRFVSSAYWAPSLLTNGNGEVSFRFKAPDNLTAFRLMAVAADAGSRFGKGARRITVTKPLLAKPVLPRFFSTGDRAEVGVVIHNYTDRAGRATVKVHATGMIFTRTEQTVTLGKGGSARVRFHATVPFVKQATLQFSVKMGRHRDALRLTVPVKRPLAIDTRLLASGRLTGSRTIPLRWHASVLPKDSTLEVDVDRTGMSTLKEGLRYLIEYPYGCLEQTLSRFIPLTKVKDLALTLGFQDLQGPRLARFIRAGADKVARHQHDDGHFSLWPAGSTYPHLTAYAMYGLLEAKRAGVSVDEDTLKRGRGALKRWANGRSRTISPGGEAAILAMAAYVLAELGDADAGLNARLYAARKAQPSFGLAFLLRALKLSKAPAGQLATVKKDLLALVVDDAGIARVRERRGNGFSPDGYHRYMSSDTRSSAIALSALVHVSPTHRLVPRLAAGLKKSQLPSGRWYNTQENLYALVALADYARLQAQGTTVATLLLNGKQIARKTLHRSAVLGLKRSLDQLKPGTLTLQVQGSAYFTVRLVTARRASTASAVSRGLAVTRRYLDPRSGAALTRFQAGQLVRVRVQVQARSGSRWIAVVDPVPAGFEPVNSKLATAARHQSLGANRHWTHLELHDDRVQAFADQLSSGAHTLEYLARATLPGTFTVPPTHAEQMYAPDQFGRAATVRITVDP
ncbi:MAG: MG2 domain-containing protein [bacterium]